LRLTPAFAKNYGVASSRSTVLLCEALVSVALSVLLFILPARRCSRLTWKRKLSPHGGRLFSRASSCPSRRFSKAIKNGATIRCGVAENGTLGGEGCAVASAPWCSSFYGIDSIRSS